MIEVGRVGQQEPFMFGFDNNEPVPWNYLGLASWNPDVVAYYTNMRTGEPLGRPAPVQVLASTSRLLWERMQPRAVWQASLPPSRCREATRINASTCGTTCLANR